ncbi:MAG: MoaD/ThiS family protein [Planctomycetes bacterium]|nr:MoaD/ThiS family protein [Planctomycetota bacterium]
MNVRVRLFGYLAEDAGQDEMRLEVSESPTAGEVLRAVRARLRVPASVRLAVNAEYVSARTSLKRGDVVSLIPPVAGG